MFVLNMTSCISILIMLILDYIIHNFLKKNDPNDFSVTESLIIVSFRLIQQNLVNSYLYYMLYWPYRFTF